MKTIALPKDLHRELVNLKLELGNKNTAELIEKLIVEYKKRQFQEFSREVRKRMKEKGISFEELLKRSKKIREEIADEWWPD